MRPRARRSTLRISLALLLCVALLLMPHVFVVSEAAQGRRATRGAPPPRPGKPEGTFQTWMRCGMSCGANVSHWRRYHRPCVHRSCRCSRGMDAVLAIHSHRKSRTRSLSAARRDARTRGDARVFRHHQCWTTSLCRTSSLGLCCTPRAVVKPRSGPISYV